MREQERRRLMRGELDKQMEEKATKRRAETDENAVYH